MRRRFRRIVVSAAAVVLVGAAGTAFVLTRDTPQTEPPLAEGVVAWIDSPAAVETPQASPLLEPAGLDPCQEDDLAQIDSQDVLVEGPPETVGYGLRVQNVGAGSCVLVGRPAVQKFASDGSAVGSVEPGAFAGSSGDGAESWALRPGHSGVAWMSFPTTPDCSVQAGEVDSIKLTVNGVAFKLRHLPQMLSCPVKISGWHSDLTGPFSGLRAEASGGSVKQGKEYTYFVELTNVTKVDVPLTPCPVYTQRLEPAGPDLRSDPITSTHRLNCDRRTIRAGEVIRYQMRLQVGPDVPLGRWALTWSLPAGPNGFIYTEVRPY